MCELCETSRKLCVQVNSEKSNVFISPHQIVEFNSYLNITSGRLYDTVMQVLFDIPALVRRGQSGYSA